jgi:hypothetical protein
VYRVEHKPMPAAVEETARRATVIDTMLLHKRRLLEILVDFALISSTYVVAWLLRFEGTLPNDSPAAFQTFKAVPPTSITSIFMDAVPPGRNRRGR